MAAGCTVAIPLNASPFGLISLAKQEGPIPFISLVTYTWALLFFHFAVNKFKTAGTPEEPRRNLPDPTPLP